METSQGVKYERRNWNPDIANLDVLWRCSWFECENECICVSNFLLLPELSLTRMFVKSDTFWDFSSFTPFSASSLSQSTNSLHLMTPLQFTGVQGFVWGDCDRSIHNVFEFGYRFDLTGGRQFNKNVPAAKLSDSIKCSYHTFQALIKYKRWQLWDMNTLIWGMDDKESIWGGQNNLVIVIVRLDVGARSSRPFCRQCRLIVVWRIHGRKKSTDRRRSYDVISIFQDGGLSEMYFRVQV